ncbi:hypothetical protein [Anaerophaga thermohalophila]|uniref:hypothetical protein n=1 Tax=Anaerophaga thermohalophila TaxID=177400 RepID=UPI0002F6E468|nr:hypothetical protein [Anaerophaga thermohalophila]
MTVRIKIVSGVLLFFLLLVFVSLQIKFPYTINVKGIVVPEQEWKLVKTSNGILDYSWRDGHHSILHPDVLNTSCSQPFPEHIYNVRN